MIRWVTILVILGLILVGHGSNAAIYDQIAVACFYIYPYYEVLSVNIGESSNILVTIENCSDQTLETFLTAGVSDSHKTSQSNGVSIEPSTSDLTSGPNSINEIPFTVYISEDTPLGSEYTVRFTAENFLGDAVISRDIAETVITVGIETACDDSVDDDNDGLVDGDDPDCQGAIVAVETVCDDGVDDDNDGLVDGDDPDCQGPSTGTEEGLLPEELPNNPPVPIDLSLTTNMNNSIDITLAANDQDQNDDLTAEIISSPSNGALSEINQNTGAVTYTPNPGFVGTDEFTFKANDGKVDSSR